jgi:tRNA (mo5U34)-methyltransferase
MVLSFTDVCEEVAQLSGWMHSIDLGNGVITPGANISGLLNALNLPEDLSGLSVLDIGAADGAFSFEMKRRGAKRVLAIDLWNPDHGVDKRRFDLVQRALGLYDVESRVLSVYNLDQLNDKFDIVLFLGVLYHLKHPFLALERIYEVTKGTLLLETHVDMIYRKKPMMRYYVGDELNRDETNFFGPNPRMVLEMLKEVGFQNIEILPYGFSFPRRLGRLIVHKNTKLDRLCMNRFLVRCER